MDIDEIKTWAKNKIESDALSKQVRKRIKETTWEKHYQREGFRKSLNPLTSQFEKPDDNKTKILLLKIRKCLEISWLLQKVLEPISSYY